MRLDVVFGAASVHQADVAGRVVAVSLGCTWHPGHGDPDGVRADLLHRLIA